MWALARLRALLRNLFRGAAVEREVDEELRGFLEDVAIEREQGGLAPAAARRAAAVEMGSLESVKERIRDGRAGADLLGLFRDAVSALKQVRRGPGFAAAVILSFGLGIGANTAVFSVVQAVLLEPLPYRDPERLQMLWSNSDKAGYRRAPFSGLELFDLREQAGLFSGFAAAWSTTAQLTGDGPPEQVRTALVTANFFELLGVEPALGRGFEAGEEGPGAPRVAILSDGLWRRRFGADPGVVGRSLRIDGGSVTVVGVAPAGFRIWMAPDANVPSEPQLVAPFPFDFRRDPRSLYYLRIVGRLRDGVRGEDAQAQVAELGRRLEAQYPDYAGSGRSFFSVPLAEDAAHEVRATLLALLAAVGMVLLLACVNVANLLVSRDLGRRGQLALRAALGATRTRLVRQAAVEALVLAGLGVSCGLAFGWLGLRGLLAMRPAGLERFDRLSLDPQVLFFAASLGLVAAVLVSALGVSSALGVELAGLLRGAGRGASNGPRRGLRRGLVAVEVALGTMLMIGAGLLMRSLVELRHVDPGFRAGRLLTFRLALPGARYPDAAAGAAFARRFEERLAALPGLAAWGSVSALPFDALPNWSTPYLMDGRSDEARGGREADARAIGPGYLATIGATLLKGREFGEDDAPGRPPVVIVDERLAERAWPERDPLGQRLQVEFLDAASGDFVATWASVVGVVKHIRHRRLAEVVREQVYVPQRQSPRQPHAYVVRAATGEIGTLLPAIRREAAALDPELPLYDARPLADYVDAALSSSRFAMRLASVFAGVALLVAAIGIFGVVSYSVTRRRREIGVRLAMGARARDVLGSVLSEGLALAGLGLVVGSLGAAAFTSSVRSLLFGVSPIDPATYAGVFLLLASSALLASALPAWRASRTDPVEILRSE